MLAILDPTGRARGDHGQSAAVVQTTDQLIRFLDDRKVCGHVHIEHAIKAKTTDSGNHLSLAIGAGLIAKAFTDLSTHRGCGADINLFGGIRKSLEHLICVISLVKSARRTSNDALSAVDAGGSIQGHIHSSTDHGIKATVVSTDHADSLHVTASRNTTTAQNTFACITNDRRGGIINGAIGFRTLKMIFVNAVFSAKALQLAGRRTHARQTILIVIGNQKLQIHLTGCRDLGRIRNNLHALADGVNTGGDHAEGLASLGDLDKAQTTSADLIDVLQIAKSGDVDTGFLSRIQNGRTLRSSDRHTVNFQIYHIHFFWVLSYYLVIALNLQDSTQAPHFTHFSASMANAASFFPGAM